MHHGFGCFCGYLICSHVVYLSWITRDRHGIARKRDKVLALFMLVLAVVANAVAVYSDACL